MEKLELKHLAPYLPYKLKCQWNKSKPLQLVGLQNGNESVNNELWTWKDGADYFTGYLYECKPILRPLSDYSDVNSPKMIELNCDLENQIEISNLAAGTYGYWNCTYKTIEIMCEKHIDFQGLIDKGLAISCHDS